MIIAVLNKTEGSPGSYGDPTITWTLYEIHATTIHPYRDEVLRHQAMGTFRGALYKITFDHNVKYIDYIQEGNRLIFSGDQFEIVLRENWMDSLGNTVRVLTVVEKCIDTVSYGFG